MSRPFVASRRRTALLLRNGRVLDPGRKVDRVVDLWIRDGRIAQYGHEPSGTDEPSAASTKKTVEVRVLDCTGLWVLPGLIDLHTHLREPGEEGKEDIGSGSRAAVAGGFTSVVAMANTRPVNDCRAVTEFIKRRAAEEGLCRVYPVGAITRGLLGEELTEMAELKAAGCVAVSDDGKPVPTAGLMRRALEYAATMGLLVIEHCEEPSLSGGAMNEGAVSTRCGLGGIPAASEIVAVARDVALAEATGTRLHVAHLSTEGALRIVRDAKSRGVQVTCEVTPHHLVLTDLACAGYDTRAKMNPPLRTGADLAALRAGLFDGTIDAVATDHAPHGWIDKEVEFDRAAFGVIGLETALPLVLELWREGAIGLERALASLTCGPARVLGLEAGTLAEGAVADVTVVDAECAWRYDADQGMSKSRYSPFHGRELRGRAVYTIVDGRVVYEAGKGIVDRRPIGLSAEENG